MSLCIVLNGRFCSDRSQTLMKLICISSKNRGNLLRINSYLSWELVLLIYSRGINYDNNEWINKFIYSNLLNAILPSIIVHKAFPDISSGSPS